MRTGGSLFALKISDAIRLDSPFYISRALAENFARGVRSRMPLKTDFCHQVNGLITSVFEGPRHPPRVVA
jgi:hypothetical protein